MELIPELHADPHDVVVVKRRYSAFLGTDLEAVLHTAGVRALVICGLMTSFCCETTARDAHGRDYEVLFAADAVEGPDLEDAEGRVVPQMSCWRTPSLRLAPALPRSSRLTTSSRAWADRRARSR